MLKSLLLSGWFRVQPFFKYVIVVMLVAPFLGVSIHSSVAKQSQLKQGKITSGFSKSDSKSPVAAIVEEQDLSIGKVNPLKVNPLKIKTETFVPVNSSRNENLLNNNSNQIESGAVEGYQHSTNKVVGDRNLVRIPVTEPTVDLIQKLKEAKHQALASKGNSLETENLDQELFTTAANTSKSKIRKIEPAEFTGIPVEEPRQQADTVPDDPMGSPHAIPWAWIMKTQEAIAGNGGSGVRHYRSIPVVSPDGRYAVYSRVQLEVKPEMHNSRVSSLLFLEDRQTKKLRVMSKTAEINDPLLDQAFIPQQTDKAGKIGVLVPVSWSQKGDRFLARKFIGIFNTADVTDHAVVWDRQQNHTRTVAPAQKEDDHEKISILLGWSQKQPDHVLFRTGELGEENWPLVQVASDGTGVNITTDDDQPVTFGERNNTIWSEPQVASR